MNTIKHAILLLMHEKWPIITAVAMQFVMVARQQHIVYDVSRIVVYPKMSHSLTSYKYHSHDQHLVSLFLFHKS
jgi:hypothetical protein